MQTTKLFPPDVFLIKMEKAKYYLHHKEITENFCSSLVYMANVKLKTKKVPKTCYRNLCFG